MVKAIAIQSDGKILIGGSFNSVGGKTRNNIARLNADGTLDETFVDCGADGLIQAIAIQSDGKILIGGSFLNVGGESKAYIARLTSTGALDTSFSPALNDSVRTIAIQSDGQILIGGDFDYVNATFQAYIARLNTNGSRDSSFYNVWPSGEVNAIAIQFNGKILIGGLFGGIDDMTGSNVYIARLDTDGHVDATFCDYGGTTFCAPGVQGGSPTTLITSIAIQTNTAQI
jgi:uncharacterized delta-60 repeat protein